MSSLTPLKQTVPHATIHWLVESEFASLLHAHPLIDRVIPVKWKAWKKKPLAQFFYITRALSALRRLRYDVVIDLQGNVKSSLFVAFSRSRKKIGRNFKSSPEWVSALFLTHRFFVSRNIPITEQYYRLVLSNWKEPTVSIHDWIRTFQLTIDQREKETIDRHLLQKGNTLCSRKIMVCPHSFWKNKQLCHTYWRDLLKAKEPNSCLYFIWGNDVEKEDTVKLVTLCEGNGIVLPKLSLPGLQYAMGLMDAVYAVDSSALHLAATTGTKTISFFGPSSKAVYKPPGTFHEGVQGDCPYGVIFAHRCPFLRSCSSGACIKNLSNTP